MSATTAKLKISACLLFAVSPALADGCADHLPDTALAKDVIACLKEQETAIKSMQGKPITSSEVQRFGAKGPVTGPETDVPYVLANDSTMITSQNEYPICVLSTVVSYGVAGSCELQIHQQQWRIFVSGGGGCKVMCFK